MIGGVPDQQFNGYSDADWAGDPNDRQSTCGMVFFFGGSAISWASRKQGSVTLLSLSEACQEDVWLRKLLSDLGQPETQPTVIREDNQDCLSFVKCERASHKTNFSATVQREDRSTRVVSDRKYDSRRDDQIVMSDQAHADL